MMNMMNILTFTEYNKSEATKSIAPFTLMSSNPAVGYLMAKKTREEVDKLEAENAALKEKISRQPTHGAADITFSEATLVKCTEDELIKIGDVIGLDVNGLSLKRDKVAALLAAMP